MSDDPMASYASPLVADRYLVVRELGSGAMGVVWEAHDRVLDRVVALKELRPPPGLGREEAVERFLTEAWAAARLRHQNIITVHDVVADGDRVLMALEFLDGHTLAELALPLDAVTARGVLTQVAAALAEAHANGIVHRDLKPENVFVLGDGRAVVCDFGLARIGAGTGTRAGTVMGTPGYLAPEQVRGESAGSAADVFAWGAIGYELLAGVPAFGSPELDAATLLYNVVNVDPAPFTSTDPDLVSLVGWSLSKDPGARPPSGVELYQALGGAAPVSGWVAPVPTGLSTPSQGPWNPGVPSLVPSGTPSHVSAMVPAKGKGGLIAGMVGLAVAVVALVVTLVVVASGGGDSDVTANEPNSQPGITIAGPATTAAAPPTTPPTPPTTAPPPTAPATPAVDASGNPIIDGWFVLVSSALKGSALVASLPGVAASNGGHVVDTDSYQTGFTDDGRGGTLNDQAAIAPNYWPGSGAAAAVVGPFPDRFAAEDTCRQRGAVFGECVRQFRPLTAAP